MSEIKITETKRIGSNHPVFIIAEIGQNHQGNIETAKKLIVAAKKFGADCVKFQKTCLHEKFNKTALMKPYNSFNSWGKTYGEHKRFLEFTETQFVDLKQFCDEIGIIFAATPMDLVSLNVLHEMNLPFIKIGSGDANNLLLLEAAAEKHIPLIISTGMQNLAMVKAVYDLISTYHKKFCLLHCVSAYPTPFEDINLNVMKTYIKEFPDVNIGYSGHELGTDVAVAAVALGAKIIEKHITLNKDQKGSDHLCSLEPKEFGLMVEKIRQIEVCLGNNVKLMQISELPCFNKLGKSIVAAKSLRKGTVLTKSDLKIKVAEPKGIDCSKFQLILGKTLMKDMEEDQVLLEMCIQ